MSDITATSLATLQRFPDEAIITSEDGENISIISPEVGLKGVFHFLTGPSQKNITSGKNSVCAQIARELGPEAAEQFQFRFGYIPNRPLKVGELKTFLHLQSIPRPDLISLSGHTIPEYGNWKADELTRAALSTELLALDQHYHSTGNFKEELAAFAKDAGRSFEHTSYDAGVTIKSNRGASSAEKKVTQARDAIEGITQEIFGTDAAQEIPRANFKNSLSALSHQGITATIIQTIAQQPRARIVSGHATIEFSYVQITPRIVELRATATIPSKQGNILFHETEEGMAPLSSEDQKIKGTINFTLHVEASDDGSLKSITCPSLSGSWDIANRDGFYKRPS